MSNWLLEATDSDGLVENYVIFCMIEPTVEIARKFFSSKECTIRIEKLSDCYGCAHENCGQKNHMECPTGCLHDKTSCWHCLEND